MDFSKSRMPEKSLRDFSGMSDLEKSILALPNHRIDIPEKIKKQTRSKKQNYDMKSAKFLIP